MTQTAELTESNGPAYSSSGFSAWISGNTLAAGAPAVGASGAGRNRRDGEEQL